MQTEFTCIKRLGAGHKADLQIGKHDASTNVDKPRKLWDCECRWKVSGQGWCCGAWLPLLEERRMSTGGLSNTAELEESTEPWHSPLPQGAESSMHCVSGKGQHLKCLSQRDYHFQWQGPQSQWTKYAPFLYNRQSFVETGDTAKEGVHHQGARGIIGTPTCLLLAARSQWREPRNPEDHQLIFFNVIRPQSISNDWDHLPSLSWVWEFLG